MQSVNDPYSWPEKKQISCAKRSNASAQTLTALAYVPSQEVRINVATNLNTPADVLAKMVKKAEIFVAEALASNPNICPVTVEELFSCKKGNIEYWLAQNPATSTEILTKLSAHEESRVRENVAKHSKTSMKTLKQLSDDKDPDVLKAVERSRIKHLNNYIEHLSGQRSAHARLLAVSFTGWPDDLTVVLKNLTVCNEKNLKR